MNQLQAKQHKEQGNKRSTSWPSVRKKFLVKNPTCTVCGGHKKLEVHHVLPFHINRKLELDEANLITLCEVDKEFNCHRIVGHLNNFKGWNPSVRKDVVTCRELLEENRKRIVG